MTQVQRSAWTRNGTPRDVEVVSTRGLSPAIRAVLVQQDGVDLPTEFSRKAIVMKSVPDFLRGPQRSAMKLAM